MTLTLRFEVIRSGCEMEPEAQRAPQSCRLNSSLLCQRINPALFDPQ